MSKPRTFQELVTKAYDIEVTVANRCGNSFNVVESKKDRVEFRKNAKLSTSSTQETMTISMAGPVRISEGPKPKEKISAPFKDTIRRRPTVKELQEKKYPFPDSDLPGMLDDLLEKVVI